LPRELSLASRETVALQKIISPIGASSRIERQNNINEQAKSSHLTAAQGLDGTMDRHTVGELSIIFPNNSLAELSVVSLNPQSIVNRDNNQDTSHPAPSPDTTYSSSYISNPSNIYPHKSNHRTLLILELSINPKTQTNYEAHVPHRCLLRSCCSSLPLAGGTLYERRELFQMPRIGRRRLSKSFHTGILSFAISMPRLTIFVS
jgi:hypothetical protein